MKLSFGRFEWRIFHFLPHCFALVKIINQFLAPISIRSCTILRWTFLVLVPIILNEIKLENEILIFPPVLEHEKRTSQMNTNKEKVENIVVICVPSNAAHGHRVAGRDFARPHNERNNTDVPNLNINLRGSKSFPRH